MLLTVCHALTLSFLRLYKITFLMDYKHFNGLPSAISTQSKDKQEEKVNV